MHIISWNVNGIRAALRKGFREFVEEQQPDILCLQETKATPEQIDRDWIYDAGYHDAWDCAEKKGYSGTTIWSRVKPVETLVGMGIDEHDKEGRMVTAVFDDFQIVNVYTPNSKRGLTRLDYRQKWDADFLEYVKSRSTDLPVVFCGDLNVAHKEIDLANPKANRRNAGFSDEERAAIDRMVDSGFIDTFREFDKGPDNYSWWTVRANARERNIGWRLDYFFIDPALRPRLESASILKDVMGSDHCPVDIHLA